ncbi:hypothetical protein BDV96DRAFT_264522 [Lophiotrema nucula]|uniref:Mid2 domain-containing protein n=1 Tax=Lophiotrema nucula TaxID=690887 RepID=A0A6A5YQ96_9PLEO|nr:hypothetical protein BDV96DRAFT_264522 [Lophiotrema nucula]
MITTQMEWKRLILGLLLFAWTQWVECQTSFIGYYIAPDSTQALNAGAAWVTSGTYAGDCATSGKCALATDCQDDTLYLDNDSTVSCTDGLSCVSMTIFQSFPNGMPSAMNYACRAAWLAYTVYRELDASTTSSSTTSTSITSPSSTATSFTTRTSFTSSPSPSPTLAPQSTASVPGPTQTSDPSSSKPKSRAWIAGPVIGGVAAIALLVIGVLWWRKKSNSREKNPYMVTHELGSNTEHKEIPAVAYKHINHPVELWAARDPAEM